MHKHAKRWTASLLAVMMILSCVLTGCSSNESEDTPEDADVEVEELSSEIELSSPDYDFDAEFFYSDYNARSNADAEYQDGIDTFDTKDIVFENMQFDEFNYLLNSEGTYLIMFGGSWSHNTRAAVPYINELAKEYGITTVYNFDFYLDGTDPNTNICEDSSVEEYAGAAYNYLYGELVSRYLTNLDDWAEYKAGSENDITWSDVNYDEHTAARVQVPFLFLYNKDNTTYNYLDENGEVQQGTAESGKTYEGPDHKPYLPFKRRKML